MKTSGSKAVPIGKVCGVRLSAPARYRIKNQMAVEGRPEGILHKPVRDDRLSWEETAKAMVAARAKSEAEFAGSEAATIADGLDSLDR